MTAADLLRRMEEDRPHFQLYVNAFVDAFRSASPEHCGDMIADGPRSLGPLEGLVAAVVSALCRERALTPPAWVSRVHSPQPFFAFPARGFALRLRLMLESPPAFRSRNVFVPENYLARA
jgi:hypothetical protein